MMTLFTLMEKKILAFASQQDSSPLSPSLIPTSTNYLTPNYLATQLGSRRVPFISPEQAVYQSRAHEPISLTPMERNDMNCPPRQQPQPPTFSVLKQCAPLNTKHILPWESPADFEETQPSHCETSRASTNTSINTKKGAKNIRASAPNWSVKETEMFISLCGELMPHLKGGTESFSKVVKRMQNIYHDYPRNAKSLCQKYRQLSREYQEHK